jgi:hypothetical protein
MSGASNKFTLVDDAPEPKADPASAAGARMLVLGLHALSQRAAAGVTDSFSLILALCVLGLAYHVIDSPSPHQIGLVGLAALFALVFDNARRRAAKG